MKNLPVVLILFRLLLVPIIILLAIYTSDYSHIIIVILIYLGLISDIFDGIIARKLKISSTKLRRMDSQVDMVFWVSIGIASWIMHPDILRPYLMFIFILIGTEVMAYAVSLIKFKRETCTHAYLSKLWGLSMLVAYTSIIGFEHGGILLLIAIGLGYLSHLDRILISLILPRWAHDIPSAYHAWLIRKGKPLKRYKLFNG